MTRPEILDSLRVGFGTEFRYRNPDEYEAKISDSIKMVATKRGSGWCVYVHIHSRLVVETPTRSTIHACAVDTWKALDDYIREVDIVRNKVFRAILVAK